MSWLGQATTAFEAQASHVGQIGKREFAPRADFQVELAKVGNGARSAVLAAKAERPVSASLSDVPGYPTGQAGVGADVCFFTQEIDDRPQR